MTLCTQTDRKTDRQRADRVKNSQRKVANCRKTDRQRTNRVKIKNSQRKVANCVYKILD